MTKVTDEMCRAAVTAAVAAFEAENGGVVELRGVIAQPADYGNEIALMIATGFGGDVWRHGKRLELSDDWHATAATYGRDVAKWAKRKSVEVTD